MFLNSKREFVSTYLEKLQDNSLQFELGFFFKALTKANKVYDIY